LAHTRLRSLLLVIQGKHYGVPGLLVDGQDMGQTLKGGRAVVDYVRQNGPAILQVIGSWMVAEKLEAQKPLDWLHMLSSFVSSRECVNAHMF